MGLPNTVNQLFNGGSPYYIVNRSLRFRSSASAYLNRTPSVAGNQQKFTLSVWAKRGALGNGSVTSVIMSAYDGSSTSQGGVLFDTNDTLTFYTGGSGSYGRITTSAVFRDPSAWYHIIAVCDTTQATATNRMALYVNGVSQTVTFNNTPAQNYNGQWNSTVTHTISKYASGSSNFDGYLAEFNYIDGQALTPSSFGAFDTNGIWQPIRYAGTYGTNGFYLPFSNTTSTTTLVADASGNGNNWTPNNISLTAGTTYDSMIDSPTVSASSSNYAVLNPLNYYAATSTISNGNLQLVITDTGAVRTAFSSFGISSGKWYWEVTVTNAAGTYYPGIGVETNLSASPANQSGATSTGYMYFITGQKYNNNTISAYGSSFTTNDVIGVALDMDGGTITFYKNNTSQGQAYSGISGTAVPCFTGSNSAGCAANFGQRPFSYTPPSGYNALNTANLPQPLISNGANYMAATTYTGNGTSQTITNGGNNPIGVTFQPDFVWAKIRSTTGNHSNYDSVRGAQQWISANLTNAEGTYPGVTAFNSNGFSIGSDGGVNTNAATYVAWQWKAGAGTTSTNTSGSITSTVSVSAQSGFSIATYTGTGAVGTIGHGLGVAPSMMIVKRRSTTGNWPVYHISVGNNQGCFLNLTNAVNSQPNFWNSTTPTSSVFTVGTDTETNQVSQTLVAYCFAAVRGYSAFGSYTGNGSADGPFIYTGFRPRFVMWKKTSSTGDWVILDSSRGTTNGMGPYLYPNLVDQENSGGAVTDIMDFLSNGFKFRNGTYGNNNASGATYIYVAFAESPFNISRAR